MFFMYLFGWYQVREFYKINHPEIILAGNALDRIAPKDAKVIASYDGDTAFLYQLKRFGWPVNDSSIDELIKRGATYYVSVNYGDKDTSEAMERFGVVEKTDKYVIVDLTKAKK